MAVSLLITQKITTQLITHCHRFHCIIHLYYLVKYLGFKLFFFNEENGLSATIHYGDSCFTIYSRSGVVLSKIYGLKTEDLIWVSPFLTW